MKRYYQSELELRKRQLHLEKAETTLQKEKALLLEQYTRVKKLERQGKRREERIGKAMFPITSQ
jgi:hypothetical protein